MPTPTFKALLREPRPGVRRAPTGGPQGPGWTSVVGRPPGWGLAGGRQWCLFCFLSLKESPGAPSSRSTHPAQACSHGVRHAECVQKSLGARTGHVTRGALCLEPVAVAPIPAGERVQPRTSLPSWGRCPFILNRANTSTEKYNPLSPSALLGPAGAERRGPWCTWG